MSGPAAGFPTAPGPALLRPASGAPPVRQHKPDGSAGRGPRRGAAPRTGDHRDRHGQCAARRCSGHVILHAGSRACHSVPLLDERGALLGVISTHHARPIAGFTRSQLAALRETADVVSNWLA
ncbi:GAF domain-containing protein [Streptomyces sp. NPDC059468]